MQQILGIILEINSQSLKKEMNAWYVMSAKITFIYVFKAQDLINMKKAKVIIDRS